MDIKNRPAFARIKQHGNASEIVLNDGMSLIMLMQEVTRQLRDLPNRYGRVTVEIDFESITAKKDEPEWKQFMHLLDLDNLPETTPEELAMVAGSPSNPKSPNYDSLFHEWQMCHKLSYRETKMPADLAMLRKHVESYYSGTQWFDGSHRW